MTECARVLRLLARRVRATKLYEADEPTETDVLIKLEDAEVLVHLEGEGGHATGALSFLIKKGSLTALHLNQWCRAPGKADVSTLVDELWAAFWAHELENRALGRIQWMHGPALPSLPEDVPVQQEFPFKLREADPREQDEEDQEDDDAPSVVGAEIAGVDGAVGHEPTLLEIEVVDPMRELLDSIVPGTPAPPPAVTSLLSSIVPGPPVVSALSELAASVRPGRPVPKKLVVVDALDLFGE